jgi:hypothetical protein
MNNSERLKQLYESNRGARAIFDQFAAMGDEAGTTVEGLRDVLAAAGSACSRRDVIAVFKKLQQMGVGFFIVGRRTQPSRFAAAANLSLADIGRGARGQKAPDRAPGPAPADSRPGGVITHRFVLRPDFLLNVELPSDLTRTEATRVAEFIKALPFG